MPVATTRPVPVSLTDNFTLGLDEGRHGALAVLILRAPADAGKGRNAIVDDDADLLLWKVFTGQYYREKTITIGRNGNTWKEKHVRWNWMFVAKGARCEDLKARCSGMWSAGRGPPSAKLDRFSAVMTVVGERSGSEKYTKDFTVEYHDLVGSVDVQALAERERRGVVVQRGIR